MGGGSAWLTHGDEIVGMRALGPGDIDALVTGVEAAGADRELIGQRLFAWLDLIGAGELSRQMADTGYQALKLFVEDGPLRSLPWELAVGPDGLLASGTPWARFSPVRRVGERRSAVPPTNRSLRVLFLAGSPHDRPPALDHERERAALLEVAAELPEEGRARTGLDLVVEERGSLAGLRERLGQASPGSFDVLHLSGRVDAGPVLVLDDERGRSAPATPDQLAEAIGGRWPQLVVLSSCRPGEAATSPAPAFVERLIERGAPSVVSWDWRFEDMADLRNADLTSTLYGWLAGGHSVETAVAQTRAHWLRDTAKRDGEHWHGLRTYTSLPALHPLVTEPGTRGRATVDLRRTTHRALLEAKGTDDSVTDSPVPGDSVWSIRAFAGRRREILSVLSLLGATSPADPAGPTEDGAEALVVHGMGGVGKSMLAAQVGDRLDRDRHLPLVHVGRLDETTLRRIVDDQVGPHAAALLDDDGDGGDGDPDDPTPLVSRIRRLLRAAQVSFLFLLDDFDANLALVPAEAGGTLPDLDDEGRARVRPEAAAVVAALVEAIRAEGAASRVLITCRHPLALGGLRHHGLGGLDTADAGKVNRQLWHLCAAPRPLRAEACRLGDGNPRLLRLLDDAFEAPAGDDEPGEQELVRRVGAKVEAFRSAIGAGALYDALPPGARSVLAALSGCDEPVDREEAIAIGGGTPTDLDRAVGSTLIEVGRDPDGTHETYRVAPCIRSLATGPAAVDATASGRTGR